MPITIKVTFRLEVTRTLFSTSRNVDVFNRDILATSLSTKNVIIPSLFRRSTLYIPDRNIFDQDAIRRIACRASVQIILLNINTIDRDVLYADVLKQDIRYEPSCIRVSFDPCAVLRIENHGIGERDVGHVVVGFSANGSDGQAVTAVAIHVIDKDVIATGDSDAIVLVDHCAVADLGVIRCR